MTPEHFSTPQDSSSVAGYTFNSDTNSLEKVGPRRIIRYPIRYARPYGSDINHERLPPQGEMAYMELAFREETIPLEARSEYASRWLVSILCVTTFVALVLGAGYPFVRPLVLQYGVIVPAILGYVVVGMLAVTGRLTFQRLILLVTLPVLVGMIFGAIFFLFEFRFLAGCILAALTLAGLWLLDSRMTKFYEEWLLAAPHLTPFQRRQLWASWKWSRKNELWRPATFATLLIAIIVPFLSFTLAIVGSFVAVLAGVFMSLSDKSSPRKIRETYFQFLEVLGVNALYGKVSSKAPGIWHPETPHRFSHIELCTGAVLVATTFAVALEGSCPWDWRLGHATYQAELQAVANSMSHGWSLASMQAIANGEFSYVWHFPVSVLLSVALSALFLIEFFLDSTQRLQARKEQVESMRNDQRTVWQWHVDRIRDSPQYARDPILDTYIDERNHLFLGIEPSATHPVLLDRVILSEHLHVTGESGSGKTSLGLMPILLQLIRGHTDGANYVQPEAAVGRRRRKREHATIDGEYCQILCQACFEPFSVSIHTNDSDSVLCPSCDYRAKGLPPILEHLNQRFETPAPPIVVIDLKGDPALFHTVRAEAEARNPGSFRWFTPEPHFSSHYFNPFTSLTSGTRSFAQVCELLLESLGLSHGEGYGRSYFTRQNRAVILEALKTEPAPRSFAELYQVIIEKAKSKPKDYEDVGEVISTLQMLAEYEQLALFQPLKNPADAIHMPSVLENRQVVYFWLPAALESVSVTEIGRLALYSLLSSAIERQRRGNEVRQCYLVIDEFQRIAGENFKIILEQARSFGIGVILANQTAADLQTPSGDLRPTVNTNTRAKMIFSVSDPIEMRTLQNLSGEEIVEAISREITDVSDSSSGGLGHMQEFVKPRLSTTDILSVNDHPLDFFLQVSRGSGYTQFGGLPVRVRASWPIDRELYDHRSQDEPWPELEPYQLDEGHGVYGEQEPEEIDRKREAWSREFEEMLKGVFEEYESQAESADT